MEISYGFSRFGRYSYDIADVLETMDSISDCDKSTVLEMAITVRGMILLRLQVLQSLDKNAAEKIYEMDDTVDIYRRYLREIITPSLEEQKTWLGICLIIHVVIFLLYSYCDI